MDIEFLNSQWRHLMNFNISSSFLKPEGKEQIQKQILSARSKGMTWDEIARSLSIPKTTLYRWVNQEMSLQSQQTRQAHPRRQSLLSHEEEEQLIQLAKERRAEHKEVTIDWTRQAINGVTNGRVTEVSKAYISNFWHKNGWPSRRTQERNQKEVRETLEEEMSQFRQEVNEYVNSNNIPSSRIYTMDETGLWNGSVVPRTYVNPETMDSGVVSDGNHRRDTGVVAISADGRVLPYFIPHTPQKSKKINGSKVIVQKKVSGMGLEQMMEWSNDFAKNCEHPERTVLLMDRLRSHTNKSIQNNLESHHIKCFHFPPQGGKLGSVCDNSFFAVLKARLQKMNTSTTEKKREAFFQLCREFPSDMVKKFYHHCGWEFQENQN